MSNKSYFTIDVFDYVSTEENVEEFGQRVYVDIRRIAEDIRTELEKNPSYQDHTVEIFGVERWERR